MHTHTRMLCNELAHVTHTRMHHISGHGHAHICIHLHCVAYSLRRLVWSRAVLVYGRGAVIHACLLNAAGTWAGILHLVEGVSSALAKQ